MALPEYAQDLLDLPAMASWPASRHLFDDAQRNALRAAEGSGRPLLVQGDPGTGKSQLAHAAAVATGRAFLPYVVDSRSEASDLMWRYDAVARLADAHLAGVPGSGVPVGVQARCYLQPGPLWWAFNWESAVGQAAQLRAPMDRPQLPTGWKPSRGSVVLIDEIDKAEAELPNGLLEALGNGGFAVPMAGLVVDKPDTQPAPLVIITTNSERELPAPFLRRCMVLTLRLPKGTELVRYLVARGLLHFGEWAHANSTVVEDAAGLLLSDRNRAEEAGVYQPGLAEYLDLLRALQAIGGDARAQLDLLSGYAFRKQELD